jgi:pimeloyl-ACP methyl ester carboxylesterase/DNA-binding SARP family transcriptional activator
VVIDTLWPDLSVEEATPRLHKAAYFARRALGRPDAVVLKDDLVSLLPDVEVAVDVPTFEAAADSARANGSAAAANAALAECGGVLLPHDLYEPWAEDTRERLRHQQLLLLRQAQRWEDLVALEPTDEDAYLELMKSRVAAGDRRGAIRQFERMERVLGRELGTRPGPEPVRLREAVVGELRALEPLTPVEDARLEQRIEFCRTTDGVTLAFATTGEGPPLVKVANWMTHIDFDWHSPVWRHWLVALSARHRLVRYDERGCGLSDRDVPGHDFEDWVNDLETVVEAAGLQRFPLLGISQGAAVAVTYAARHPERVSRLVLYGSYPQGRVTRATTDEDRRANQLQIDLARHGWGQDDPSFRQVFTAQFMPEGSRELWEEFNELQRQTTSADNAARVLQVSGAIDVVDIARRVQAPTLVLHARRDRRPPFEQGRLMADLIPNSRFVALDSCNHVLLEDEPAWPVFLSEVETFLAE